MPKLQSFFKAIKQASQGHRITSVGIELGSSSIKLVQFIEDKGKVQLGNYGELDLGPLVEKPAGFMANLDAPKLQQALTALLANTPINNPEAVAVAIPLSATLVVPLQIKAGNNDAELDRLVHARLKSEIPVPISQVYIDWQVIDKPQDQKPDAKPISQNNVTRNVLAFVINKEIIDTYKTVLNNLELPVTYFELEAYSVMRSAIGHNVDQAIIVDIGARYTKIYAIEGDKIISAHKKLNGGVEFSKVLQTSLGIDFAKAEKLKRNLKLADLDGLPVGDALKAQIDKIVADIRRVRAEFSDEKSLPIYLCGGGSLLYGLPEYVAKTLDSKITICQPFINAEAPEFLDKLLVETGPEYAVAAGLALKYIHNI
jgi:type IV pilus assembly protein PilM